MTELSGFPEIGIISLYYYFAGGTLDPNFVTNNNANMQQKDHQHCDFGIEESSSSPCFIPPCITTSELLQEILQSLALLTEVSGDNSTAESKLPKAGAILGMLSKSKLKQEGLESFDHMPPLPSILVFWEKKNPRNRQLSPLLQLLLLKLLYVTPQGGPFLAIACRAVPHLELKFCLDKQLERYMRNNYKSHWAYYILIKAIVLGERIKPSRRAQIQYHVPIWDIVFGLDSRDKMNETQRISTDILPFNRCGIEDLSNTFQVAITHLSNTTDKPLQRSFRPPNCFKAHLPLYVLGDSHALSIGWQTICIDDRAHFSRLRTLIPNPVTGLKAWHTRPETQFFTYTNLRRNLERIPNSIKTIILTAGEIDCREGIGGEELSGYNKSCNDAVLTTVVTYVKAIQKLSESCGLQILLMPVAPHAHRSDRNGKSTGRAFRRERMKIWNDYLREECKKRKGFEGNSVFLLDYEEDLRERCVSSSVGFVLNKSYNADYTHMNSAFLPLLEKAILNSGCDLGLL